MHIRRSYDLGNLRLLTCQIFELLDHRVIIWHQRATDRSHVSFDSFLGGLNSFIVAYFARRFNNLGKEPARLAELAIHLMHQQVRDDFDLTFSGHVRRSGALGAGLARGPTQSS